MLTFNMTQCNPQNYINQHFKYIIIVFNNETVFAEKKTKSDENHSSSDQLSSPHTDSIKSIVHQTANATSPMTVKNTLDDFSLSTLDFASPRCRSSTINQTYLRPTAASTAAAVGSPSPTFCSSRTMVSCVNRCILRPCWKEFGLLFVFFCFVCSLCHRKSEENATSRPNESPT